MTAVAAREGHSQEVRMEDGAARAGRWRLRRGKPSSFTADGIGLRSEACRMFRARWFTSPSGHGCLCGSSAAHWDAHAGRAARCRSRGAAGVPLLRGRQVHGCDLSRVKPSLLLLHGGRHVARWAERNGIRVALWEEDECTQLRS